MKQTILKVAVWSVVGLLLLSSVGYNAYMFLKSYEMSLLQQGAGIAVQQVVQAIKQKGSVELPVVGQDGKVSENLTLIQKIANDVKK